MHYGEIKNCDIANGLGVRVTLFVSGCTNHCENCFQPQTWDFCYGKPFTSETEDELIRLLSPIISTASRCSAVSRSSLKISARCCRFSAA